MKTFHFNLKDIYTDNAINYYVGLPGANWK